MAGALSQITPMALEQVLRQKVELPAARIAAAALTVAFQVRREGHLTRGETVADDVIKDEIKKLYYEFMGVTDPQTASQMAQQGARRQP